MHALPNNLVNTPVKWFEDTELKYGTIRLIYQHEHLVKCVIERNDNHKLINKVLCDELMA